MKTPSTTINESNLQELYAAYGSKSLQEFREFCRELVKNARAPNPEILRTMDRMSKDQLLFTTNNFAMKGHGLGVIKK